jgi:hypothetical protein
MKNRSVFIIYFCLALIILILGFLFFEIRNIPDVKWQVRYDYEDEEPMGLYVFKEVVNRYFEDIDSKTLKKYKDTTATNGLYFYGQNQLSYLNVDSVMNIANKGNDVFIFANYFPYELNDTIENYYSSEYQFSDTLSFNFINTGKAFDTVLNYHFVDQEFSIQNESYNLLSENYGYNENLNIVSANDSLLLMLSIPIGEGNIYYHVLPQLFFNYSYRQPQIFNYTERILSHFNPDYIVFLNTLTSIERSPNDHPLQFIMSSSPLKTAYYLFVIGLFLYAVLGGKRKQKSIPITDKNENTSLEYIETVSQLFYQQNQHEKLVAHMKIVFFHKIEQKYFIKKDHPEYLEVLTKKSKIPKADLQYILNRFQNHDDKYTFGGDQLISLNKRLEQIYVFINNKN